MQAQFISYLLTVLLSICLLNLKKAAADVIMMGGQGGMPSILENDDFDQDVILMPGMGGVIMNEDLVL